MEVSEILQIITAVVPPILSILTIIVIRYFIPYLKTRSEYNTVEKRKALIDSKNKAIEEVDFWVRKGVEAAEQIYKNLPKSGAQKNDYVLDYLEEKGIDYKELGLIKEDIQVLIEAWVLHVNQIETEFAKPSEQEINGINQ